MKKMNLVVGLSGVKNAHLISGGIGMRKSNKLRINGTGGMEKMKVYELMQQLSKMPAGATVQFNHLMSIEELTKNGVETAEEGTAYYSYTAEINETEISGAKILFIYTPKIKE